MTQIDLGRGIETCFPEDLLTKLSEKSHTIKFGADPSAPDLHLGHMVILNKLRAFQEKGHHIIFIIGDFTAMIGDPTGKSETRKPLDEARIKENAKTYQDQLFKILDRSKTTVVYNSDWLGKLSAKDMVQLSAKYTVARMLERDDFTKRFSNNQSISIHEFLYPLLQGYDSVHLKNDIEIGGTDQTFNLLMGRHLQKESGQKPQGVITMPILEGLDGHHKMSKSLANHIGLLDSPKDMFGKLMSIPDHLIMRYFSLLTSYSTDAINDMQAAMDGGENPKNFKLKLAKTLVTQLHSSEDADTAEAEFARVFSDQEIPTDMPETTLTIPTRLDELLVSHQMVPSKKEAHRLISQGGVSINQQKVTDPFTLVANDIESIIKAGKRRWLKVLAS
jgi:tyrosyl-tRNA synthetase